MGLSVRGAHAAIGTLGNKANLLSMALGVAGAALAAKSAWGGIVSAFF